VSADALASGGRDAPFILNIVGMWMAAAETDKHVEWVRQFSRAIQPHSTGAQYINFLGDEGEGRVKAAYGEGKFARLVALKNKYDPKNLFRLNQNIRPAV
jgi:FAD/FMN-containing dehydrogenase